ncbi:helix-turn-helix transcriptional regulator [Streptomyces sp. NPDC058316]|uniref:helix-turn-helix transcriptional regulator n=1 Tax=Streptomyces sp. NPDC058316 TaxID=3346442 RepID=UPI0036E35B50
MSTRPMLTQREAATACGVSRTTIRRRREAGDLPGAVQDSQRGWLIPVDDLLAAGLRLHAPAPPDAPKAPKAQDAQAGNVEADQEHEDVAALRAELERMQSEHALAMADERHGRELAEAEAAHLKARLSERGAHIEDLQRALAALMPAPERAELAGPAVPAQARPKAAPPVPTGEEQPRRRWWGGRR